MSYPSTNFRLKSHSVTPSLLHLIKSPLRDPNHLASILWFKYLLKK